MLRDREGIGGTREGFNLASQAVLEVPIVHDPVRACRCVGFDVPCNSDLAETKNCCGREWLHRSKRKEAPYAVGPQPVVLGAWMAIGAVGYPGATNLAFNSEEGSLEAEVVL
jgi:hypothetical protein